MATENTTPKQACNVTGRCSSTTPPLTSEEIDANLKTHPMWKLGADSISITRSFTAVNFMAAIEFFNKAAEVAEKHGHHPDLHLTNYRDVEVILTTHHIGKLSEFDFAVASDLDAIEVRYSKKWLKENPTTTPP